MPFSYFASILQTILIVTIASNISKTQITLCSHGLLSNESHQWQYCIKPTPTNRSWYKAMAECRFYGGELVSFEWPEKAKVIRDQLTGYAVNFSQQLFVNAHKPFYSGNDQFAWKTGETIRDIKDLISEPKAMEICVYSKFFELLSISCEEQLLLPLVCQRTYRRMYFAPDITSLNRLMNISHNQIIYQNETCEYLSFVLSDYNWYQSKVFCETINSDLMGVPNDKECVLFEPLQSFIREFPVFLNIHLYMYNRDLSDFSSTDNNEATMKDYTGKSLGESSCNFKNKIVLKNSAFCIEIVPNEGGLIINSIECDSKPIRYSKGFICKQCHPNQYKEIPIVFTQHAPNQPILNDSGITLHIFIITVAIFVLVVILLFSVSGFLLYKNAKIRKSNRRTSNPANPTELIPLSASKSPTLASAATQTDKEKETGDTNEQEKQPDKEGTT